MIRAQQARRAYHKRRARRALQARLNNGWEDVVSDGLLDDLLARDHIAHKDELRKRGDCQSEYGESTSLELSELYKRNQKYTKSSSGDTESCSICREEMEVGVMCIHLGCGHPHHAACMMEFATYAHGCPTCRRGFIDLE